MILRLGANAAAHTAAGFAFGVLGVLAACTVAQAAARIARERQRDTPAPGRTGEPDGGSTPYEPPAGAA